MAPQAQLSDDVVNESPVFSGYRPLSDAGTEIRLLHLLPVGTDVEPFKSPLRGTLEHHSLNNVPPFIGLSYYWGKPDTSQMIILDGDEVRIRQTVFAFLQNLRHRYGSVIVWLDMLCINQRDFKERSVQVSIMGDIYRNVESVHAWLGEAADRSDYVFDKAFCFCVDSAGQRKVSSNVRDVVRKVCQPAVARLFCRPYWTRVWIVQELVLAKKLCVMCGSKMLTFDDFNVVQGSCGMNAYDIDNKLLTEGWSPG